MDIVPFRCSKCGAEFGELLGGICERCGRLLCERHLRTGEQGVICDACVADQRSAGVVTDAEQDRVVELLSRDVLSTLGREHADVIRACATRARQFEPDVHYYQERLVNEVQERFHDERIDTAWPRCPRHPDHPLRFSEGEWRCHLDGLTVARLGELGVATNPWNHEKD